ncbi:hypothetical protein Lser_V15G32036 [Lactuca serriola]
MARELKLRICNRVPRITKRQNSNLKKESRWRRGKAIPLLWTAMIRHRRALLAVSF